MSDIDDNRSGPAPSVLVNTEPRAAALLEVIVVNAAEARAAQDGGADRLELVRDRHADGYTPDPDVVREVLAVTDLPVRVMLRERDDFTAGEVDVLRRRVAELRAAGAAEFVLGFLNELGDVDMGAVRTVLSALGECPWTFHRAVDHAVQYPMAFEHAVSLGPDTVLSAGSPDGVEEGIDALRPQLAEQDISGVTVLVGGDLRAEHVPALRRAGARAFHIGQSARDESDAVRAELVRNWRASVDG